MDEFTFNDLMRIHISATVPLLIADLIKQHGYEIEITEAHHEILHQYTYLLNHYGDELMYSGTLRMSGKVMAGLCEALAFGAFRPVGITFAGMHFEVTPEQKQPPSFSLDGLPPLDWQTRYYKKDENGNPTDELLSSEEIERLEDELEGQ